MTQDDIDALTYEDESTMIVKVPVPAQPLLQILKAYHIYRYEEGDPIGDDE
jgi:hypothetical protein